jgi:uncharacterized protein (TIGR03437 family)
MMIRERLAVALVAVLFAGAASAQVLNNASLNGKYYVVQLLVTAAQGSATDAQNFGGSITFNGAGAFTFTGRLGRGSGAPAASSGNGTYTVAANGTVTLTNPIRNTLQVLGRLSGDGNVLIGASTEASDNTNDLFIAIKAPTGNVTNSALNGTYTGASLQFPNGTSAAMKSAVLMLVAGGNGQFSRATVVGHAADQAGRNVSQEAAGSTYNLTADGSGTASFGTGASLFSGARDVFVSQDGNYLLGTSSAAGGRDIFVAAKNFSTAANNAAFDGRYWIAEITVDGQPGSASFSAASGALRALGNGRLVISQRLHQDTSILDFTAINSYSVNADSTGNLAPLLTQGVNNMGLGVSVSVGGTARPTTVVGAQIGAVNATSSMYGLFIAVRAQSFTGSGVFLSPDGVVHGASFAPTPNPLCPGQIASLFGSGLAPREGRPSALPLPTTLEGVSVTVNGTPAPLFFVSAGQVNIQVPYGLTGNSAAVVVTNAGQRSNEVTVPLARTCPGIFSYSDQQSPNRAIILHADFTLVTPTSPARPGETVIIYLTGLGDLNPVVPTGAGNPASPLSTAVDRQVQILFGGEVATNVAFIGGAPFFAGLNQINAVIPQNVVGGTNVPVAISTGNAFTDLVDISIGI